MRRREPPTVAEPEAEEEPNEFDSLIGLDENWSELYDEGPRRSRASLSEEADRKHDAMQNMASRPRSFHDDLTRSARLLRLRSDHSASWPSTSSTTWTTTAT